MIDLFGDQPRTLRGDGYAGRPGAGPAGETCGTCKHRRRSRLSSKTVNKCGHPLGRISGCEATDILVSAPACEHWSAK